MKCIIYDITLYHEQIQMMSLASLTIAKRQQQQNNVSEPSKIPFDTTTMKITAKSTTTKTLQH